MSLDLAAVLDALFALPRPALLLGGLFAAAVVLGLLSRLLGSGTGLPAGSRVVASDTKQGRMLRLSDPDLGLRGQPDFILSRWSLFGRKLVGVEVKPTRKGIRLHDGDRLQIGVYMLLLQQTYGRKAARYGYVRYRDQTFTVRLTRRLRKDVIGAAGAVRRIRTRPESAHRSHDQPARCAQCSVRGACPESLA